MSCRRWRPARAWSSRGRRPRRSCACARPAPGSLRRRCAPPPAWPPRAWPRRCAPAICTRRRAGAWRSWRCPTIPPRCRAPRRVRWPRRARCPPSSRWAPATSTSTCCWARATRCSSRCPRRRSRRWRASRSPGAAELVPRAAALALGLDPVQRALALAGVRAPGAIRQRRRRAAAVSRRRWAGASGESGQAAMVLVGLLVAVVLGAVVLGGIARGVGVRGDLQSAADLSALAAARAMHDAYPRVFEPAVAGGAAEPAPPRARRLSGPRARRRRARPPRATAPTTCASPSPARRWPRSASA